MAFNPKTPATKKQKDCLMGYAVPIPNGLTKLEAMHLIREAKERGV